MRFACRVSLGIALVALFTGQSAADGTEPAKIYEQLKTCSLTGGVAAAHETVLQRDRLTMTFHSGTFYFAEPVAGKPRAAVFIGQGSFKAEIPANSFEQDNVRRLLKADVVESDFRTAVLRFTDDTFEVIGKGSDALGAVPAEAHDLASKFEPRLLKETGANISARQLVSIVNAESPGFFLAQFDGGKRDRFTCLLDYQARILVSNFDLNGGEKGLIFAYRAELSGSETWMAFYSLEDYQRGLASYSDQFDLIAIPNMDLRIDLREPKKLLKLTACLDAVSRVGKLIAIPLAINEGLGEYDNQRLKKAMRVKSARLENVPLATVQEDWDSGLVLLLPEPVAEGGKFKVDLDLEGDFMYDAESIPNTNYPLSNTCWYPRHGYLNRSKFHLTFLHKKDREVASVGRRVGEQPVPDSKSEVMTEFQMDEPVALVTFAIGPFELHSETRKTNHGQQLPIEFYSLPGTFKAIKEDFVLAELGNCVDYFGTLFGAYPYGSFRATYHPFGFGQGLPSLLMIPASDRASKYTYSFIAHETSHQWWGDVVAWRSYRDQWLSEGFAEYSGILYTGLRASAGSARELLQDLRRSIKDPPSTDMGIGRGRLTDVGPLIMGHRLQTRRSMDAYETLIYNKGALVLRMLHFLFTDPESGDGKLFFAMMQDFVKRHANGWATTDDFIAVANAHFPKTPIGQKYKLTDLNWFFYQWVFQTHLPRYRFEYRIEKQDGGGALLKGIVFQDGVPETEKWFMPLPLTLKFGKDAVGRSTIPAYGPQTPITLRLPAVPQEVELDPALWVLSEKTEAAKAK